MPPSTFILMLLAVFFAAGMSVWLISGLGPTAMAIALPVFLIATLAVRRLRK
jgi:hypothetical protein